MARLVRAIQFDVSRETFTPRPDFTSIFWLFQPPDGLTAKAP
jgi:hypothetical protein